jgi:hypothetical protein
MEWIYSTAPADRKRAEDGVRQTYRAAGVAEPVFFLWLDDLLDASVVMEQLAGFRQFNSTLPEESLERREQILTRVTQGLGLESWDQVIEALGPKHTRNRPTRVQYKGLSMGVAVPRADTLQAGLPTAVNDDPTDYGALEKAAEEIGRPAFLHFLALDRLVERGAGPGSPGHRGIGWVPGIYDDYRPEMLFRHDCLARIFRRRASMAYDGLLRTLQYAGPWWPFAKGAVLCDRPREIHRDAEGRLHRADGPAVAYGTGLELFSWHGTWVPAESIREPASLTPQAIRAEGDPAVRSALIEIYGPERWEEQQRLAPKPKPRHPLEALLPDDPAAKIEKLRSYGSLPLCDRYLAGEHRQVWVELQEMGAAVREEQHAADALAVAYAMMMRVRESVASSVERLSGIGYEFECAKRIREATPMPPMIRDLQELRQQLGLPPKQWGEPERPVAPIEPPEVGLRHRMRRLERDAGTLPLSLRAFWEVVGSVDLRGNHPTETLADPLAISPFSEVLSEWDRSPFEVGVDGRAFVIEIGDCRVTLPCCSVDAGIVEYLRRALGDGSF